MQRFLKIFYGGLFCLCIVSGYREVLPGREQYAGADWPFIVASFVITLFFPSMAMAFSRLRGVKSYRRPTFDRWPFSWWTDTLQPLRVMSLGAAALAVGGCLALPRTDQASVMLVWQYVASALGVGLGERLVYRLHRDRILKTNDSPTIQGAR